MRDEDQDDDVPSVIEKSGVAREVENLRDTVLRFARERERLPQPLFWSLFNSRIKEIKKTKESDRLIREALGQLDES